ncbi:MAG: hypothetical protein ANABAC_0770 [Anaerolineae bacterium]|jgi:hypothetical protein|nr:MAG: hypothetical protein ANABAC_0770 [Anaerolineae bacterium]
MSQSFRFLNFLRKILQQSRGVVLYRSNNPILCNFILETLQENQIPAYLSQEAVGQHIYPVNVGKLAESEIIVAPKDLPKAKECLEALLAQIEESESEQPDEGFDPDSPVQG